MFLADSRLTLTVPQLPVPLHLGTGFLELLRSKWQCFLQILHVLFRFVDQFAISLNVYFHVVIIGKCSFNFGRRFIWAVLFCISLRTSRLSHLENPVFYKMLTTMVKYTIIEVPLIRNKTLEYILCCGFCFKFLRWILFSVISVYFRAFFFYVTLYIIELVNI